MAATEATSRTRRTRRINRATARRGAHAPAQAGTETSASHAPAATPAFHITPNVVIAARGTVRSARRERRSTSLRSLRRFAA